VSAPTNPQADVFTPVAALLEAHTGVKSYFGFKHLAAVHAPPRYVWVPTTGAINGAMTSGGYPNNLVDVAMTYEVHCWHASHDQAWALVVNLLSACHHTDGVQFEAPNLDASPNDFGVNGEVITVQLIVRIPLFEADLEQPTFVSVDITGVEFDDSQGVVGDGVLTPPSK